MCNANIGYLYYKEYYKEYYERYVDRKYICKKYYKLDGNDKKENKIIQQYFNDKNEEIIENSNIDNLINEQYIGTHKICLKTTYPGLLVGSGYSHIISCDGEFKLGFEFDYTTGLPTISGSSVKGLLRSTFYNENDNLKNEKQAYIQSIMNELGIKCDKVSFEKLTYEMFEGKNDKDNIPMYDRDVFYDAVIDVEETKKVLKDFKNVNNNKYILGEDFITPHYKNPLKNPVPLKFLKVMPNIVWRFQFDLKDQFKNKDKKVKYSLKAVDKKKLFERILLDFGIGAKTNVGYGRLEKVN